MFIWVQQHSFCRSCFEREAIYLRACVCYSEGALQPLKEEKVDVLEAGLYSIPYICLDDLPLKTAWNILLSEYQRDKQP